ncbi:nicotinate phosphoribosyltransferase [Lophium mytilinum]|uniref:nicotinate phosphoribosyltransferase n=1 Tax=Lophium mytilinum TaxID=390894 RepID=A0A6A6QEB2_9PEZI|nr:nicotinate phosphoribosyltransferase [Lophium mytilinum]
MSNHTATTSSIGKDGHPLSPFLDLSLYKLAVQWAIVKFYPNVDVVWKYTNRSPDFLFNQQAFEYFKKTVEELEQVIITNEEVEYLKRECPYFPQEYLDHLCSFRYDTNALELSFHPVNATPDSATAATLGEIAIIARGSWQATTLFENAILRLLVEAYYRFMVPASHPSDQGQIAYSRAAFCIQHGIHFADFGSRRGRDMNSHKSILEGLQRAQIEFGGRPEMGNFLGSSNVHLSRVVGLKPVGTMPHEWFMGTGALSDNYASSTIIALTQWIECYGEWFSHSQMIGLALPDTFGSTLFLDRFSEKYTPSDPASALHGKCFSQIFTGLRIDSANPKDFIEAAAKVYACSGSTGGIDAGRAPTLMFSDSMNPTLSVEYNLIAQAAGFHAVFSMGRSLWSDFEHPDISPSIVFKLQKVAGRGAIKISDVAGKAVGDPEALEKFAKLSPAGTGLRFHS